MPPFDATPTTTIVEPSAVVTPKDRLLQLAEFVESLPWHDRFGSLHAIPPERHEFHMNHWFLRGDKSCGTVGCIGGSAELLFRTRGKKPSDSSLIQLFDIDGDRWGQVCNPDYVNYNKVSPSIAGQVIRHLAETGKVVWPRSVSEFC